MLLKDVRLTTSTILGYYLKHWDIEISYRYHKNSLGFDEYYAYSCAVNGIGIDTAISKLRSAA